MIPRKVFFTKGVGRNSEKLSSFEEALRDAGVEECNFVHVSSILPPGCEVVDRSEGVALLETGQITFVVMAENSSCDPGALVSAAIGLARPASDGYGYLSEHTCLNESAGEHAEDLAATMLATALGIEFDPQDDWDQRKRTYRASGKIIKTSNISQSARVGEDGRWTTVLAAAVFII